MYVCYYLYSYTLIRYRAEIRLTINLGTTVDMLVHIGIYVYQRQQYLHNNQITWLNDSVK